MLHLDEILSVIAFRKAVGASRNGSACDEDRGSLVPPPRCSATAAREAGELSQQKTEVVENAHQ